MNKLELVNIIEELEVIANMNPLNSKELLLKIAHQLHNMMEEHDKYQSGL
jgi:3-deoxy-D-manno-octulosonic acid (KDO) 8-phosphate synthase